ncbi:N-6 DNA methylase [Moorella sulfitireducens]|uniref:N-6 DNA methylase n=1 Tax=Neomoorella sulfitireducens TaxID=2972948 RepID=UPI0021ACB8C8|nr:N-6 DNA methylase [Moorella sulfitireducens]
MVTDLEQMAAQLGPVVARELLTAASWGRTESDFRREATRILEEAGVAAGLTIIPRDEFAVARGRVDSVYNRLILEYKKPGVIKPSNQGRRNNDIIQQVKDYINDVAARERRDVQRLAGVALDGHYFIFVRRVGEGWSVDDPVPVNPASTTRFLRLLFSLATGAALVPENLLADFGPLTLRAQRAVQAFYQAIHNPGHPLVARLYEQWHLFYGEVTEYREWKAGLEKKGEFRRFVNGMGLKPDQVDPAKVIFAIHTYYALLIKLIATMAASRFAGGTNDMLARLASLTGDELKQALTEMERGGLFREYGIRNFLEGDFFGWYLAAWNENIAGVVSHLLQRLADYDPGALELAPENARDLLKKLYHTLLPREIRHTLGEYYTPDWLAERLIRMTLGTADLGHSDKRILDPSCGSGTFLVLLIKHIRKRAERNHKDPVLTLEAILNNVVGFDLNPLAVIAARTNYLLALGDLLSFRRGDISIPVYQADSILTPGRGTGLFDGDVYPLKTSVGVFRIPAILAGRQRMDILADVLDETVAAGTGVKAFLARFADAARLDPEELEATREDLVSLYRQLYTLHVQGLDGVWARIIKNAFTPLFLEQCDYVIGNPPWVNWENLPDEYRQEIRSLFEYYGLFPHGGMDTILGKGKKDIAMLMTYVAVDKYLRRGGKLGFILTQSLFKTSGAGQGFRRFRLPDGTPFGPLLVEDMVDLNPFEGATNRTAVAIFSKGREVKYPVAYSNWKKKQSGRGSSIGFDTPYEEVTSAKATFHQWYAEPVQEDDTTSAWITARLKALKALRRVMGGSSYTAHAGSYTGGANGVYWVEVTGKRPGGLVLITNVTEGIKRDVPRIQAAVEQDLLFPLLRGRDVRRWQANPSLYIIMAQDPATRRGIALEEMASKYPRTHAYLARFETILRNRATFRRYFGANDPYWSMFNISPFTFAPWKVVWREQASEFTAAVIGPVAGRPVIPDHKLMMVETHSNDEAYYLCAMLNSSPTLLTVTSYAVEIQMDTHILRHIKIPRYSPRNDLHRNLAKLSCAAHQAAAAGSEAEVRRLEAEIDRAAARIWQLSDEELAEIQRCLEEA